MAVVHDWLTGMRGGEAVLEAILDALPGAELFTLIPLSRARCPPKIEARTIHTSSVQQLATRVSDYRQLLPLFPRAVRQWDFSAIRPHRLVESLRGQGRRREGEAAPLVLPHADALHLGSLRRLLPALEAAAARGDVVDGAVAAAHGT